MTKNKQVKSQIRLGQDDDKKWTMSLYGAVGDEYDGFTDESVAEALRMVSGDITVHVNSPGGSVFHGAAIHNMFKAHKGSVHFIVDGLAASMASNIIMAGKVSMYKNAMLMVHDPWSIAVGNSRDMRASADMLDKIAEAMMTAYMDKTGQDREALIELMQSETWLTAQEALDFGFADEIIDGNDKQVEAAIASLDLSKMKYIPDQVAACIGRNKITAQSRDTRAVLPADSLLSLIKESSMGDQNPAVTKAATEQHEQVNADAIRAEAIKAERTRVSEIQRCVSAAKLDADFANALIAEGISAEDAKDRIFAKLAEDKPEVQSHVRVTVTRDERDTRRDAVASAILNRYSPGQYQLTEPARAYRGMSLMEMAREFVEASGKSTRGMSRNEIASAALHTTSDFPSILENIATKSLRDMYEAAPRTFVPLARRTTLPDYKEVSRAQLGEAPQLKKVVEHGEYTRGTVGEAAEKYRLFKYGRVIAITREVLINDDLDAFTRVPGMFGRSAADLESDLFWEVVTSNPNMHDGVALFHTATHGNLAGTGGAISVDTIGAGRAAMRKQKGLDKKQRINVQAQFIVVPAALETKAEQFVSNNLVADAAGNINPFAGRLQAIAEPRLDDDSLTAWYLFASPQQIDTIEYAYMQGEEGPVVESREGFDVDGMEIKCRLDFGVKAIDWRGMYKNAGG